MMIKDPIEMIVAEVLQKLNVDYVHELENPNQRLDFYLPDYEIYIECKAFSTPRTSKQIEDRKVILIQSKQAAWALESIIWNFEQRLRDEQS